MSKPFPVQIIFRDEEIKFYHELRHKLFDKGLSFSDYVKGLLKRDNKVK